jgi:hypothetical protein
MRKECIWGILGITALAVTLVVGGRDAQADVPAAPAAEPDRTWAATLVVTSTADSGTGTLRWALQTAVASDTITFDTSLFPPGNPQTITLTSGLPDITQGNLIIDGSDAGVVLDGSGIGTTPERMLLDDVSLTLDGGPNLIANGDFGAGLGHWRPWDDHAGATRSLNSSDFRSAPNGYEWNVVAHTGESRTVYDTTDTSDPADDPFDEASTAWIPAAGGSTVTVRFWYKNAGAGMSLYVLFPNETNDLDNWWFASQVDWTEAVVTTTLPGDAIGVGITFSRGHSERWTSRVCRL